jgi:hypothetical protein
MQATQHQFLLPGRRARGCHRATHDPYIYTAADHRRLVHLPNPLLVRDNYPLSCPSDRSNGGGVRWRGAANVNPPRNRHNPPLAALSL